MSGQGSEKTPLSRRGDGCSRWVVVVKKLMTTKRLQKELRGNPRHKK